MTSIGYVCATILGCLLLVAPWGVPGAAWAVVIGSVVGLILKVVAGAR
jgi:Na+-driven multidrug efflux pump